MYTPQQRRHCRLRGGRVPQKTGPEGKDHYALYRNAKTCKTAVIHTRSLGGATTSACAALHSSFECFYTTHL